MKEQQEQIILINNPSKQEESICPNTEGPKYKSDAGTLTACYLLESDQTYFFPRFWHWGKKHGPWSRLGFTLSPFQILGNFRFSEYIHISEFETPD